MSSRAPDWVVVDDFLEEPDAERERAVKSRFEVSGDSPVRRFIFDPPKGLAEDLKIATGADEITNIGCRYHFYPAKDAELVKKIHADRGHWAGVVYLNREREGERGNAFYHHKATELDRVPSITDLAFHALERKMTPAELVQAISNDSFNPGAWNLDGEVSLRYNRLVVFPARRFHSLGDVWGTTPADSRLTLNFYFEAH